MTSIKSLVRTYIYEKTIINNKYLQVHQCDKCKSTPIELNKVIPTTGSYFKFDYLLLCHSCFTDEFDLNETN